MVGLEKLWEGDVHLTGTVEDFTGGAVDLSGYHALMIRYHGHINASSYFGLSGANDRDHDGTKDDQDVDIVNYIVRKYHGVSTQYFWVMMRDSGSYSSLKKILTETGPLRFSMSGTADLHFSIYGMKL